MWPLLLSNLYQPASATPANNYKLGQLWDLLSLLQYEHIQNYTQMPTQKRSTRDYQVPTMYLELCQIIEATKHGLVVIT